MNTLSVLKENDSDQSLPIGFNAETFKEITKIHQLYQAMYRESFQFASGRIF